MASQVSHFDEVLQLTNSVLDDYKSECDAVSQFFIRNTLLSDENEQKCIQYLEKASELLENLQQVYNDGEEKGTLESTDGYSESNFKENKEKKIHQEIKSLEEIEALEKEKNDCNQELQHCSENFKHLEERRDKLNKEGSKFIPWKKDVFALFTTTTGIRWNFGCNDNEIRGYVAGKSDVKPFSINADEHDPCHIANYLWDVVDSAFVP